MRSRVAPTDLDTPAGKQRMLELKAKMVIRSEKMRALVHKKAADRREEKKRGREKDSTSCDAQAANVAKRSRRV